jgi:Flp pilus assembly protein TadB
MADQGTDRLRSLERESMYRIFAPLDADEPLPRELVKESRRYRTLGRRELAGALWLPAVAVVMILASWAGVHGIVVLGVIVLLLFGFVVFAVSGGRKAR